MFAIVEIAGFQEKVQKGDTLRVPLLNEEPGKKVTFENVYLIADGEDVTIGTPYVAGASVEVKVLENGKDDKIRVFKMKRRKRYRRTHGHRQDHTDIEVVSINASGAKKAPAKKEVEAEK